MKSSVQLACIGSACVACGCCVPVCPKAAIHIDAGVRARVNPEACVGCGRCAKACPAAVITVAPRRTPV